jgi:hypothetical protein
MSEWPARARPDAAIRAFSMMGSLSNSQRVRVGKEPAEYTDGMAVPEGVTGDVGVWDDAVGVGRNLPLRRDAPSRMTSLVQVRLRVAHLP